MEQDLEKFIQAIEKTEAKYGSGETLWITYLYQYDVNCFTASEGARDSIISINPEALRKKVFWKVFQNLEEYLEKYRTYTENPAANHIIKWFSEKLSEREVPDDIMPLYKEFDLIFESFENMFPNQVTLEILKGNLPSSKKEKIENHQKIIQVFQKLSGKKPKNSSKNTQKEILKKQESNKDLEDSIL